MKKSELFRKDEIGEVEESPTDHVEIKYIKIKPGKSLEITDDIVAHVRKLAGLGLTVQQIYNYYGMSDKTWGKKRKRYPELELAMKQGRAVNIGWASQKLREKMEAGNLGAIIFYLKTQGGWREKEYNNDNGNQGGDGELPKVPSIILTVNDPIEAAKIYQQIMTAS